MTWHVDGADQALRYLRASIRAVLGLAGLALASFVAYLVVRACWEAVVFLEENIW